MHAGLRFEDAVGDALGGILHATASAKQLRFTASGDDRDVLFEVVKNQRTHGVAPLFFGGYCVKGQLQALVGVFLIAGLTGLVVDDGDGAVRSAVDTVDAAND